MLKHYVWKLKTPLHFFNLK